MMPDMDSNCTGRGAVRCGVRHQPRPFAGLLAGILVLLLATPAELRPHTRLRSSEPTANAVLTTAPREVRLRFSEAVGLALTRVTLLGPGGTTVALGTPVQPPDSAAVVIVPIEGALRPGVYRVEWQTAGKDGHPIRGRFEFTIAEGTVGADRGGVGGYAGSVGAPTDPPSGDAVAGTSPAPGDRHTVTSHPAATPADDAAQSSVPPASPTAAGDHAGGAAAGTGFSAESPLYALVRLLLFVATFGVTGAIAFRYLVLGRVAQRGKIVGYTLIEEIGVGPARVGEWFSVVLGVGLVLRVVAQGYALGGGAFDGAALRAQLTGTVWGWGWWVQAAAASLAWLGFRWAGRGRGGGWVAAGVGVLALCFTTGLTGHAAGLPSGAVLALAADAGHILGAGGWLGGLLLLLVVGVPAARRVDERWSGAAIIELVNSFSTMALACAALVVLTGGIGALVHVGSLANLIATEYGKTLLLKLALLGVVVGAGAYNYLRVRPMVGGELGARRLRTSSTVELIGAIAVLAVTAFLVAMPTP